MAKRYWGGGSGIAVLKKILEFSADSLINYMIRKSLKGSASAKKK